MADKITLSKVLRSLATAPVGAGAVFLTLHMANASRPLDSQRSLLKIPDRPDVPEPKIEPETIPTTIPTSPVQESGRDNDASSDAVQTDNSPSTTPTPSVPSPTPSNPPVAPQAPAPTPISTMTWQEILREAIMRIFIANSEKKISSLEGTYDIFQGVNGAKFALEQAYKGKQ